MRSLPRTILAVSLFVLLLAPAAAQEIKLASVAPEQSPWGSALNQMAAEWARLSSGRVRLRVYHNAIAGDEADMLRKMRIGQLQAGVFTSSGMKQVVPEVFALSVPFLIGSAEQLSFVLDHVRPDLEAAFQRNRLHVLAWSRAGWVHFFSRRPVVYPEDLKQLRLAADPTDAELLQAFGIMGYRPIPMPLPELLTSLNSGLVDAFYTSPLVAAGYQWFGLAPHMLDLKVAPFLGAIVITDVAWRSIPANLRPQFLASAQAVADRVEKDVLALEEEALATMKRFGLTVQEVSPEVAERWTSDIARFSDAMLSVFAPAMTTRVRQLLAEFERR